MTVPPENPMPEQILAAAARTAKLWTGDWGIYLREISHLTGLTLTECLLFDMVLTWRDISAANKENIGFVKKHIEREHGDEDWKAP
jgi:hypothetical protein